MASRRVGVVSILLVALIVLFAFPPGYGIYFSMFLTGTAVAFIDSWFPSFQGFSYLVRPVILFLQSFLADIMDQAFRQFYSLQARDCLFSWRHSYIWLWCFSFLFVSS
jgi:hypothetical protein